MIPRDDDHRTVVTVRRSRSAELARGQMSTTALFHRTRVNADHRPRTGRHEPEKKRTDEAETTARARGVRGNAAA